MIDIHAHILPGIDDGAKTIEDSIALVRELVSHGVTDIIATPHYINESVYTSSRDDNLLLLEELKGRLEVENIAIHLFLGNELYIDKCIPKLLKEKTISPMADSDYILVELPMNSEFPNYVDILASFMNKGWNVILAHPERYEIVKDDYSVLDELSEMGILFQCNIGSITGQYGNTVEKVIKKLAKEKRIFAFGTDIHRPKGDKFYTLAIKKLRKYYDEDELEKVLVTNPEKIIYNK